MPEPNAPAEGATDSTQAAATATSEFASVEAYAKQAGLSPDQIILAAKQAMAASTPEGAAQIAAMVEEAMGDEIATRRLLANPETVLSRLDSKDRRKVRRAVERRDGTGNQQETEPDEAEHDPAVEARVEAREAAEKAVSDRLSQQDRKLDTVARMVQLQPVLDGILSRTPQAAAYPQEWRAEVASRIATGHPRYQGKDGPQHASEDVINGWSRAGEMAGMTRPAGATPKPGADIPIPDPGDINKVAQESYRKGGSKSMVDSLMATLFPGS